MKRIYLTHCSAKKDISLKGKSTRVDPIDMYTATPTQRFMNKCMKSAVDWAIFSDKYGIWHSNQKHEWYEKDPSKITNSEFKELVSNFETSLNNFDEIWFYYNPGRFHRIYKKLINSSSIREKIKLFTHLDEIEKA